MKQHIPLDTDKMLAWSEDGIGWMIFNNPEKLNAMGVAMNAAIPTILHSFRDDPDVRVVVMAGAGDRAFVSGADISEFEAQRSNPETIAKYDAIGAAAGRAYGELQKPIIAMIQGFCMGGGLLTALRADLRIASDDSQFGVPAARLGLGYGYGGVKTLADLVGLAAAQEILLTGKRFPAADAARWGLVNRVTTRDELEPTVHELAATIAQNAPLTIRGDPNGHPRDSEGSREKGHAAGGGVGAKLLRVGGLQGGASGVHGEAASRVPGGLRAIDRAPILSAENSSCVLNDESTYHTGVSNQHGASGHGAITDPVHGDFFSFNSLDLPVRLVREAIQNSLDLPYVERKRGNPEPVRVRFAVISGQSDMQSGPSASRAVHQGPPPRDIL